MLGLLCVLMHGYVHIFTHCPAHSVHGQRSLPCVVCILLIECFYCYNRFVLRCVGLHEHCTDIYTCTHMYIIFRPYEMNRKNNERYSLTHPSSKKDLLITIIFLILILYLWCWKSLQPNASFCTTRYPHDSFLKIKTNAGIRATGFKAIQVHPSPPLSLTRTHICIKSPFLFSILRSAMRHFCWVA